MWSMWYWSQKLIAESSQGETRDPGGAREDTVLWELMLLQHSVKQLFQDGWKGTVPQYNSGHLFSMGRSNWGSQSHAIIKNPTVNVLLVEGGGLVKSFWTDSNCVIASYLNPRCSFNWLRCFPLLTQNSGIAFLCSANWLQHFPPMVFRTGLRWGFPSILGMFISAFQV